MSIVTDRIEREWFAQLAEAAHTPRHRTDGVARRARSYRPRHSGGAR